LRGVLLEEVAVLLDRTDVWAALLERHLFGGKKTCQPSDLRRARIGRMLLRGRKGALPAAPQARRRRQNVY
jgi:hypothetical protein